MELIEYIDKHVQITSEQGKIFFFKGIVTNVSERFLKLHDNKLGELDISIDSIKRIELLED